MMVGSKGWLGLAFCWVAINSTFAQDSILSYQGRISVAGAPFSGRGFFSFVIVDGADAVLWASGPFPRQQTTNLPAGVIALPVTNGLYSVRLGDPSAGMPELDGSALAQAVGPKLRIWFNDGTHAWQQAGDEVPLAGILGPGGEVPMRGGLDEPSTAAILRELKQLRMLVDRQRQGLPAPAPHPSDPVRVTVPIGGGPALGRSDAPLVLVEFTDYQCPFCKRFQDTVLPQLKQAYVDTGKLRIVTRTLAMPYHTNAEPAALAALCAEQQHKFWPMRERLFANSDALSRTNFIQAAEALGLDLPAFRACLEQRTFAPQLKKDSAEAQAAGISGTPTFVLGKPADGNVSGVLLVGARPFAAFEAEVNKLLATLK